MNKTFYAGPHNIIMAVLIFAATLVGLRKFDEWYKQAEPTVVPPVQPIEVPPEPPVLEFEDALEQIDQNEVREWLYHLASDELEGRMSGKKGYFKAADYVENLCKSWGLKTERQRFKISRRNPGPHNETGEDWTENVFAYIEGENTDEYVVIGSHLDHIGYGPSMARDRTIGVHNGADDNASGSCVTLAAAKAFSKMEKPKRTVVFQWYSAEEMGLIGSRYFCNNPTFPKNSPSIKKCVAMLNSDMVGRLGTGWYHVSFYDGNSSIDLRNLVDELNPKYSFSRSITSHGSGGSDHACFYNQRVPIAFFHTGLHSDYHKVSDDADKINYSGLAKICKYATEYLYRVANAPIKPRFTVSHEDFVPMEYTHDHGHPDVPFFIHSYHKDEWMRKHKHSHDHEHNHEH